MIEWGSVADWVSGVGTLAAFGLGLKLLFDDRTRSRRRPADAFASWTQINITRHLTNIGVLEWKLTVNVHNSGTEPIIWASVAGPEDISETSYIPVHARRDSHQNPYTVRGEDGPILKDSSRSVELIYKEEHELSEFFLEFADSHGVHWVRHLDTLKYMPERVHRKTHRHASSIPKYDDVL
ncbi:hypothetical protein [Rathayibacter sp. VKM Ac-2754]|uniref:hypothetical protein n=1 Tax=Rathayibacter sp. VKM Ac-2754 TaxID=2609251 RepID=UPI00135BE964|nr:hypothetical protein [Rathayibacter sp. VKM Ac-2754]MWV58216.1 hypothetical protein [Rathayibacter sp. VKM Ac-2754]